MLESADKILFEEDRAPHDPAREFALAASVRFDAALRRFVVLLSTGAAFRIDIDLIEPIRALSEREIAAVNVGANSRTLVWPELGIEFAVGELIDATTRLGLDVETLPKPLGMVVMQPLYCCPACETVMGTCKKFKTNTYGSKTEDYSYDGE